MNPIIRAAIRASIRTSDVQSVFAQSVTQRVTKSFAAGLIGILASQSVFAGSSINNKELSEKEWRDETLIKEKLRLQGAREHENLSGRLMHGIVNFHLFLPTYEKTLRHYIIDKKRRRFVLAAAALVFAIVSRWSFPIVGMRMGGCGVIPAKTNDIQEKRDVKNEQ